MKRLMMLAAALAAAVMTAVPATAQKVSSLPAAATLTGPERIAAIQGSGCATGIPPCANVTITPVQLRTFLSSSFEAKDATLTAIAGLTTAADTCSVWTGVDAVATYSCSSFGRSLAGSTNAAAARGALVAAASGVNADLTKLTALSGLTITAPGTYTGGVLGQVYGSASLGIVFGGQGSTYDFYLINKNGAGFLQVPTGTTRAEFQGVVVAPTLKLTGLPTYASDSAAGSGGLTAGEVYKTSTGELRIKL